ncbi:unnamed protein product [Effrenium voratum]|uniref:Molybdate-anion transporter n=1 Tax=Effrenium voratum TaxID=2562239 RepID=A0AA36MRY5_9DINO|nr:unnamed protein product [Effrenium voratum]CAJ1441591.1 unnamed protein product [Effrenium voratum]
MASQNMPPVLPHSLLALIAKNVSDRPDFYQTAILPLALLTGVLGFSAFPSSAAWPNGFPRFVAVYLSAWTLCVASDWLQGPYVYALYEAYGFSPHQIAQLFLAGFGAAMFCSSFVGGLADRYGRKRGCIAYCLLCIVSCATKHWKSYSILMVGRITGGFAQSLLFSCFECWMVSEHTVRNQFCSSLLPSMFGMKFSLMYLVAVISGFIAQCGADSSSFAPVRENSLLHVGGNLVPFDMAACVLVVALAIITIFWEENFGHAAQAEGMHFWEGLTSICHSKPLLKLGLATACFESAMYSFVFNWTPALESADEIPPHGVAFALMMMACMCGASVSSMINDTVSDLRRLQLVAGMGFGAFAVAVAALRQGAAHVCFCSFLLFEFCVGIYFPAAGSLKSKLVPERLRVTVYNMYRVPMNAAVVSLLLTNLSTGLCFRFCCALMGILFLTTLGLLSGDEESVPEGSTKEAKACT